MDSKNIGSFLKKISYPLGISQIILEDSTCEYGFCCDSAGARDGRDITEFAGWRNYLERD